MGQPQISERLRELTRPTGEEELLDIRYPRPRFRVPVWQAVAVACAVVVGLIVWLGVSSRPAQPEFPVASTPSIAPGVPSASSGAAVADSAPAVAEQPTEVVVSVVGEVAKPGLVTLPPGARLADALHHAHPHPHADLLSLNQAQKLEDSQQIVVGAPGRQQSVVQGGTTGVPVGAGAASAGAGGGGAAGGGAGAAGSAGRR